MSRLGLSSRSGKSAFVSPFARPSTPSTVNQNSTSTSIPSKDGSNKRKVEATDDYVPDSADEEEDAPSSSVRGSSRSPEASKKSKVGGGGLSISGRAVNVNVGYVRTTPMFQAQSPGGVVRGSSYGMAKEAQEKLPSSFWMVQWRKPQSKKHKTWDGDGVLVVRGSTCTLFDMNETRIGGANFTAGKIKPGDELRVGGKDIEIDHEISAAKYLDGSCFGRDNAEVAFNARSSGPATAPFKKLVTSASTASAAPSNYRIVDSASFYGSASSNQTIQRKTSVPSPMGVVVAPRFAPATTPGSKSTGTSIGPPLSLRMGLTNETTVVKHSKVFEPRFDPTKEGAVVMRRPSKAHQDVWNKKRLEVVDVVVNPDLAASLRPHQVAGVKFMYECVMGMKNTGGAGCILADEMGLGKTLQTIALVQTLLQQTPYRAVNETGVIGKVLIVCPVSLVQNWKKEFRKWIGNHGVGVFVGTGDRQQIRQFTSSRSHQVLLIGYEKLRTVADVLAKCQPPIGLVVCDEGHRLKSKDNNNKTIKAFESLQTKRRIILSGTPLQNDLGEFWAMCDFANPGILGTYSSFNKIYEKPILKSRAPKCSAKDQELGQARANKLGEISEQFIIRRTADILSHYLPPKHEYVLFIAPTPLQLSIFGKILTPKVLQSYIRGPAAQSLGMINHLRKICSDPSLMKLSGNANLSQEAEAEMQAVMSLLPKTSTFRCDPTTSGKLLALEQLLALIKRNTDEKIVVVSNYTSTLDVLESLCHSRRYEVLRLDGTTAQKNRQELVDQFNRGSQSSSFVFLLSSKAGGVGLNLIGASRLVLFDSDWNPSNDLQAMARIHRDGQRKPVFIYRFLTTGSIEEKIYQRQITKLGLSDQLINDKSKAQTAGSKSDSDSFSAAELKDLFTMQTKTDGCQTHDLLECDCVSLGLFADLEPELESTDGETISVEKQKVEDLDSDSEEMPKFIAASSYDGKPSVKQARKAAEDKKAKLAALRTWKHLDAGEPESVLRLQDSILQQMIRAKPISDKVSSAMLLEDNIFPDASEGTSDIFHDASVGTSDLIYDDVVPESDVEDDVGEAETNAEGRADAKQVERPTEDEEEDEEDGLILKRNKLKSWKTKASNRIGDNAGASEEKYKYDLQKLAADGFGGRVTFIFERVSGSVMA